MSKTTIALGSSIIGLSIMLTFLWPFLGNHTSTRAQSPSPRPSSGTRFVDAPGLAPSVPPLGIAVTDVGLKGVAQQLDGLNCEKCTFTDVVFEYAGGNFRCVDCTFTGSTRLILKGAAANTAVMLRLFQSLNTPPAPKGTIPVPQPRVIPIDNSVQADWISPK